MKSQILYSVAIALSIVLAHAPVSAEERHREAGAHVHGKGTLSLAIEGGKVEMELEAPAADVLGFEYAAKTDAEKAALTNAKSALGDALALFRLPDKAGCNLETVTVEQVSEAQDEAHGEAEREEGKKGDREKDGHDKAHADHGPGAEHSEFHATYKLACAAPEHLTTLEAMYFKAFPAAEVLVVNVTTAKGQTQQELTRDKSKLDLAGMI